MRRREVRFGEEKRSVWAGDRAIKLIEAAAEKDGVSFSQFVREAALAHAVYVDASGGEGEQAAIAAIVEQLRRGEDL